MAPSLVRATGAQLDDLFDQTYPLWGDGLSRRAYAQWNTAQERTDWGRRHLRRLALVDGDRVLATAKRYDLVLMLEGRPVTTVGVGAVFTPLPLRGRGFARAVIEALVDQARADGAELALLFSEIGSAYYERMGFSVVPVETANIAVQVKPGAPAVLVRAGEEADAEQVAAMYAKRGIGFRLSLTPSPSQVRYMLTKKRLFAGLDPSGRRTVEYFVAEEGHRAAAFVLLQITRAEADRPEAWSLEACGDADPSGARVGALLQALVARAPGGTLPRIQGWWPASLRPPQLTITSRAPAGEVMMIRPLVPGAAAPSFFTPGDVLFWHADAF
jgi:GNAT superfamily N-acetyltransferase